MKKRIVHIISSLKRGGAESLLVDLLAELHHYEHQVIYFHDGPNRERLERQGIKTYNVCGLVTLYDPVFFAQLFVLVRKLKPDCIHSALWAANFASRLIAKILQIPLVSVVHLGIHQDGKLRNFIDKYSFSLAKKVVAVSDEVADSLQKKAWIPAQRISVIINGISAERIQTEALQEKLNRNDLNIDKDAFVVGSVGRFIERKNFSLLINAFATLQKRIDNSCLILVGFGPLEKKLRNLVQNLGIENKVRFIVGKAAYSAYPLFDCFALPSLQEGMSIALLEAMCFGRACIVTSPTAIHEVIKSGSNGLVVPSNDEGALTQKLLYLAENKQERDNLGAKALESIATHYSMAKMAHSYERVFEGLSKF